MNEEHIIIKLKQLIKEGTEFGRVLYGREYSESSNLQHFQALKRWKTSSINLLRLRFGEQSYFFKSFISAINPASTNEFYVDNLRKSTGVLESVLDALENGLTEDLFYQREVILFSTLLEQAYEFLSKGLREAAAIYGRIVLETTIKEFANKNNIQEKSFDQAIIKLRQAGLIHQPLENSLRAMYQIGSDATHNNKDFQNYSDTEIKEYVNFIRDKVLTLK